MGRAEIRTSKWLRATYCRARARKPGSACSDFHAGAVGDGAWPRQISASKRAVVEHPRCFSNFKVLVSPVVFVMVRWVSEMTFTMKVAPFPTPVSVQNSTSSPHAGAASMTITIARTHLMPTLHAQTARGVKTGSTRSYAATRDSDSLLDLVVVPSSAALGIVDGRLLRKCPSAARAHHPHARRRDARCPRRSRSLPLRGSCDRPRRSAHRQISGGWDDRDQLR